MSQHFEYRGDLAVTPLPEILATVHRYRVPGIMSLSREGRMRRIFLEDGLVVFAASNEREDGLETFLLRRGLLEPEAAREAQARRVRDGLRLGQVLLQMGVLTPERLNQAVLEQVREVLWGAFEWDAGEVLFEVGSRRGGEFVRIDLPIPAAILEGIRRTTDVKRLAQRLGTAQTVLEKTPGPLIEAFPKAQRELYEAVDGKTPLQRLCARGPGSSTENARLLYGFFCFGLLRRMKTVAGKKIQYRTGGGNLGN